MNTAKYNKQNGFSLTEVLVVIAIVAIIAVFAVAQFGNSAEIFEMDNIARELKVKFERARFDSVKRRPSAVTEMARVVINDETSFSVTLDSNQNNILETSETQVVDFSGRTAVKILETGMNFPVTVVFDRRGHIMVTDATGAEVNPVFTVCNNCTAETANAENAIIVAVSATGTVSMYNWGDEPATLTNPTVTTVGTGSDIDPMIAVEGNGTAPVGTPAPTPVITPTPTPISTPTPTPTPTPSTTEEPTPTPTERVCLRNERPAQTGCVCQSPMEIKENGQCK